MKTLADITEAIARKVTGAYYLAEHAVVGSYQKIEHGAVSGFAALTDRCVDILFAKEGETTQEAKARLAGKEGPHA